MSLLSSNKHCRNLYKLCITFQRRFQQTKAKPRAKSSCRDIVPVFRKATEFTDKVALRDAIGSYTYGNIFMAAKELSEIITRQVDGKTGERVMYLCPNDASYLITQWAIWMSGQIAIPLSKAHPQNLLLYYCNDSNAKLVITAPEFSDVMQRIVKNTSTKLYVLDDKLRQHATGKVPQKDTEAGLSANFYNKENAMILYTSGTTGNPKGVVLSHKNLVSQCTSLLDAWKWAPSDVILHTLPLHHVHGIVNALYCPLYIGAKCIMLPKFDSTMVWSYLLGINASSDQKVTVFMGVPTIYTKLIEEYKKVFSNDSKMCEYIKNTLKAKVRLMVSGSAPLPIPVYQKWLEISGHRLLERYGMTEIGMCLSQLYDSQREPGYVGVPLPGVSVRLGYKRDDDEGDYAVLLECSNLHGEIKMKKGEKIGNDENPQGELLVKGDSVFKEYYNRPEATLKEFTIDNWFKTGDMCQYTKEKKLFKILGRSSVDIIKTGGYKVSALEIETNLLEHPDIEDCAVVGIKDEKWGEKVAAILVLKPEKQLELEALRTWAKTKMPEYAAPTVLKIVTNIPKNAMGKVNKKELVKNIFSVTQ